MAGVEAPAAAEVEAPAAALAVGVEVLVAWVAGAVAERVGGGGVRVALSLMGSIRWKVCGSLTSCCAQGEGREGVRAGAAVQFLFGRLEAAHLAQDIGNGRGVL